MQIHVNIRKTRNVLRLKIKYLPYTNSGKILGEKLSKIKNVSFYSQTLWEIFLFPIEDLV